MPTMYEQLKAKVEKQDWFILSKGTFTIFQSYSDVELDYKDEVCEILIYWIEHRGTFQIQENRRFSRHKKRPKTVEDACEAICNIYSEAIERWDDEEERKQQEEIARQKRLQQRKETIKAFGLSLQAPILRMATGSMIDYNEEFSFIASQKYQIQFVEIRDKGNEPERFAIEAISGIFTMDQIKSFITLMAECPQVMADRLLNGK